MSAQIFLTPMHLLALDIYNRRDRPLADRAAYLRPLFAESLYVRMARVGVVYGIAGIGNKLLRGALRENVMSTTSQQHHQSSSVSSMMVLSIKESPPSSRK